MRNRTALACLSIAGSLVLAVSLTAQRGADNPFPGGTNPDGSLRPTAPRTC